jgi:hypothetical protein
VIWIFIFSYDNVLQNPVDGKKAKLILSQEPQPNQVTPLPLSQLWEIGQKQLLLKNLPRKYMFLDILAKDSCDLNRNGVSYHCGVCLQILSMKYELIRKRL